MSEPSPGEQNEQDLDVDWPALKIAVDEMNAALALFTGNFDSPYCDDAALLSDINSRAQGLRQAVNKDEKHTLSPEAIIRALVAVQFDLRHLPRHETKHGLRVRAICKAAILLVDPSRKPENSDVPPSQPPSGTTQVLIDPSAVEADHDDLLYRLKVARGARRGKTIPCTPNTRMELFDEITSCLLSPAPDDTTSAGDRICWLIGSPGTGKSSIARSLVNTLGDRAVASFFCSSSSRDTSDTKKIIPTLVAQLAQRPNWQRFRDALDTILPAQDDSSDLIGRRASLDIQFQKLIVEPFGTTSLLRPAVIIIDGLDECIDIEEAGRFIAYLGRCLGKLPANIKFLISSRNDPRLRRGMDLADAMSKAGKDDLEPPPRVVKRIDLDAAEYDDFTRRDIGTYLRSGFAKYKGLSSPSSSTKAEAAHHDTFSFPREDELRRFVTKCIGLPFIVAGTVFKHITSKDAAEPRERMRRFLNLRLTDVPFNGNADAKMQRLNEVYAHIISVTLDDVRRESRSKETPELYKEVRMVLGCSIVTQRPLSINALADLLGLEASSVRAALERFRAVIPMPRDDSEELSAFHNTWKTFVAVASRKQPPTGPIMPNFDLRVYLAKMTVRTLTYLVERLHRAYVDHGQARLGKEVADTMNKPLGYSCSYWITHLEQFQAAMEDEISASPLTREILEVLRAFALDKRGLLRIWHRAVLAGGAEKTAVLGFLQVTVDEPERNEIYLAFDRRERAPLRTWNKTKVEKLIGRLDELYRRLEMRRGRSALKKTS